MKLTLMCNPNYGNQMVTLAVSTPSKILFAAQQLMLANGDAGLRVDAVAAAANLNKRLIYHYFGNREGLVHAVLLEQVNVLLGPGSSLLSESTRRVLTLFLTDLIPQNPSGVAQVSRAPASAERETRIPDEQMLRRAFHLILPVLLRFQEQQSETVKAATQGEWPLLDKQQFALDLTRLLFPDLIYVEDSIDRSIIDSEYSLTSPKPRYRMASTSRPAG